MTSWRPRTTTPSPERRDGYAQTTAEILGVYCVGLLKHTRINGYRDWHMCRENVPSMIHDLLCVMMLRGPRIRPIRARRVKAIGVPRLKTWTSKIMSSIKYALHLNLSSTATLGYQCTVVSVILRVSEESYVPENRIARCTMNLLLLPLEPKGAGNAIH